MSDKYKVIVVEIETDETVKSLDATNARIAWKLRKALEINLNHNEYEVRICSLDG